jgi:hypothetical protein
MFMSKRLFSACLGLAAIASVGVAASAAPIISQNFDDTTVFPAGTGLTTTGSGSSTTTVGLWRSGAGSSPPTPQADPAADHVGDQAILVTRTGASATWLTGRRDTNVALSGNFTYQTSLYRTDTDSSVVVNVQAEATLTSQFPVAFYIEADGKLAVRNLADNAWSLTTLTIPQSTWTQFRALVNRDTGKWS